MCHFLCLLKAWLRDGNLDGFDLRVDAACWMLDAAGLLDPQTSKWFCNKLGKQSLGEAWLRLFLLLCRCFLTSSASYSLWKVWNAHIKKKGLNIRCTPQSKVSKPLKFTGLCMCAATTLSGRGCSLHLNRLFITWSHYKCLFIAFSCVAWCNITGERR